MRRKIPNLPVVRPKKAMLRASGFPQGFAALVGVYLTSDEERAALVNRLIVDGYALAPGSRILMENVLLEQFIEQPEGEICKLNLESGENELVCSDLGELCDVLHSEGGNYFLASSLLEDWERLNGQELGFGRRLCPTIPFIMGGAFEATNLHASPRLEAIAFLQEIHKQTKNLTDGTRVNLKAAP